ncbi:MAG: GHKL domain-containing protein [Nitrosopumilus sp.]|nr:GHKL domain-containing protein [Nitrosopumilus sp.]
MILYEQRVKKRMILNMMLNSKQKITSLVFIQVFLIIGSFLTLTYIESEWLILGNSINNAGLNRFLSASVMLGLHSSYEHNSDVSLDMIRDNFYLLKNGGYVGDDKIRAMPDELMPYWETAFADFEILEKNILAYNLPQGNTSELHSTIDSNYMNLLKSSDDMASQISIFLEEKNTLLIQLQIIFLIVNSAVHIFLVFVIFRILNKVSEEKIRLEKFAIIGKLGATIAHDLRNPLTVIKGSVDLLKLKKEKSLSEKEENEFKKIDDAIENIDYLTKDVLNFAKTSQLHLEQIGLLQIIKKSINEINVPNHIKIILPENDSQIKADKIKIQIVISNLIKNAIEAIDGDGVITIGLIDGLDSVLLTITDTGRGMDANTLSSIFEPLFTTKMNGTGLGLVSCKRIIDEHGGSIEVLTNPTRFFIHLLKK